LNGLAVAIVADQSEIIAFLQEHLAGRSGPVRTISTHASLVFLTANRAFKLKRAVHFPFLDFSTPEKRLQFCQAELTLNRRTAPKLYLGVYKVTREADGKLTFDGPGELVDAVLEMRRFEDRDLFDNLAQHQALTPALMTTLARRIAAFHKRAEISKVHGGAHAIGRVLDLNEQAIREASLFPVRQAERLAVEFRSALQQHGPILEQRREAGKVRRCHGDLILRNICLFEGEPILFDCLEFDEDLATIDVLYDLAFLLMDLWHRGQQDLANLVFNRYLDEVDETDGLALVPFFMAMRATVRAHVTAIQASEAPSDRADAPRMEAEGYFELACRLMKPMVPTLITIGGFSGSGKSTAAASIAVSVGLPPGARVLASDRIRKGLHGVAAEVRLPESAYRRAISEQVYDVLRQGARQVLATGFSVVADAVFERSEERNAIEQVAREAGVSFSGFWLTAPVESLTARVARREHDPSDATTAVVLAQAARDLGEICWHLIRTEGNALQVRDKILACLRPL
jgi:aminoglycoside phosphotransferase family enzyme/predicted kinase